MSRCNYGSGCSNESMPGRKACFEHLEKRRQWSKANRMKDPQAYKERMSTYYQSNKLYILAKVKTKLHRLRDEVYAAYGNVCVCCRESYRPYLELDHMYGGGSKQRKDVGQSTSTFLYFLRREGYPKYIQILCSNCHTAKTRNMPCKPHY